MARSCSVIAAAALRHLHPAGRYFATGSVSATSPRSTASASSSDVNTFVIDPISNTVSPSSGRASSFARLSVGDDAAPDGLDHADDDPDACLLRVDPVDENLADLGVGDRRGYGVVCAMGAATAIARASEATSGRMTFIGVPGLAE